MQIAKFRAARIHGPLSVWLAYGFRERAVAARRDPKVWPIYGIGVGDTGEVNMFCRGGTETEHQRGSTGKATKALPAILWVLFASERIR